jgi:hypothetical protein
MQCSEQKFRKKKGKQSLKMGLQEEIVLEILLYIFDYIEMLKNTE